MVCKFLSGILLFILASNAFAGNSVPQLVPFQGRLTEPSGVPINYPVTVKYRVYPPTGTCYLYEDTQLVTPNSYGIFSVLIGGVANSSGPVNNFAQIFNNDATSISDSCAGAYVPVANDWRRIEVLVDGVPFTDMQTVGAAPFAFNSNMLEGKRASDFILNDATVTQAALTGLLNGSDASGSHNHDSLYAKIDGSNSYTGNISTTGSIGVGTSSVSADVDIQKNSPRLRLGAATGGGGTSAIEFYSGTTIQRARIESSETTNTLKFFTGSAEAMSIDANKNLLIGGSLKVAGTVGLGAYTAAQDTTLVGQLTVQGFAATGTMWIESTSGQLRYWNGSAAKTLLSQGMAVQSVTAGTGLADSGTATDPVLSVSYGSAAGTAIEGNATFGGDISGTYTNLTVNKIKGRLVDDTGLAVNKILKFDGTNWVVADDGTGWSAVDSSYAAKGIVQFDTNAAVSGINVVGGVASVNVGTSANQIVKLDGTAKLPAVDASALSNLNASSLSSGTLPTGRLPAFTGDVTSSAGSNSITLNTVPISKGGTGQTTQATAFNALSPLSTKGDVVVFDGANNIRLAVGSDGRALVADSSQTAGVKWADILATDILSLATTGIVQRNGAGSYSTVTVNGPLTYTAGALGLTVGTTAGSVAAGDDARITGALQKSGGTMSGSLSMGAQDVANVGNLSMAANKVLSLSSNAADPGSPTAGQVWYNSTSNTVNYFDGTAVKSLGVSDATFAGDVSGISAATSVDKIKGKAVAVPTVSGQYMVYDGTSWVNVTMSGDATMSASGAVTLKNSGTAGTYTKVTTDAQGRVTSATNIGSSDVTTALGYTPVNRAGDNMTGALQLNAENELRFADADSSNYVGLKAPSTVAANKVWTLPNADGTSGQVLRTDGSGALSWTSVTGGTVTSVSSANGDISIVNGTTTPVLTLNSGTAANQIVKLDGTAKLPAVDGSALTNITTTVDKITSAVGKYFTYAPNNVACANGEVLKKTANGWECGTDNNTVDGDASYVVKGNIQIDTNAATSGLNIASGVLSVNSGTAANQIVKLDGTAKLPAVDGSALANVTTTVDKISSAATKYFSYMPNGAECSDSQVLKWDATNDRWLCAADAGAGGADASSIRGVAVDGVATAGVGNFMQHDGTKWTFVSMPVCTADKVLTFDINGIATCSSISGLTNSAIAAGAAIARNKLASGTADHVLINDGSGVMSSEAQLSVSRGGTGQSSYTDGQLLIGKSDGTLAKATLTAGTGVSITNGDGTITINSTVDGDASYAAKGNVQFDTNATTSGMNIASGVASVNTGTAANQIVKLDGTAKLPPVDGSALTNITTTVDKITSGAGKYFTYAPNNSACADGEVLKKTANGWECGTDDNTVVGDASYIAKGSVQVDTNAATSGLNIASGVLSINSGTAANQIVKLDGTAKLPAVDGSALTNVTTTVDKITSGAGKYFTYAPNNSACANGEVLKKTANGWECSTDNNTVDGDASYAAKGNVQFDTNATTSGMTVASGVASVNTGTAANQIVKLDGTAKLPAVDGSALTNITTTVDKITSAATKYFSYMPNGAECADSQVLKWDATNDRWLCAADAGSGGADASSIRGVAVDGVATAAIGNFMQHDGTKWTFVSMPVCTADKVLTFDVNGVAACTSISGLTNSAIAAGAAIARNKLASGTADHVLINDGSGVMSSEAQLSVSRGGTGQSSYTNGQVLIGKADGSLAKATLTAGTGVSITNGDGAITINSTGDSDASYTVKGNVQVDTDAATSGLNIASGVLSINSGTAANQIVKLDGTAKLPAVDGSALTSITTTVDKITSAATKYFSYMPNGAECADSQVLKWDAANDRWLCAADAGAGGADASSIRGVAVDGVATAAIGNFMQHDGTKWTFISMPVCTADKVLTFDVNGIATCSSISGLTNSAIAAGAAIARNKLASGTADHVLINDGSGVMSSEAQLSVSRGGTGQSSYTNGQVLIGKADGTLAKATLTAGTGVSITNGDGTITINSTVDGDASYAAKGNVQFDTNAATSGVNIAAGVASVNTGTAANQIVKLDGSAKLPAVDGSALTNITTTVDKITSAAGKYFTYAPNNAACADGEVLKKTANGWECGTDNNTVAGDASYVAKGSVQVDTNAVTSGLNITSGVLSINAGTAADQIVKLDGSAKLPAVDGSALTNLNASNLSSGTLAAARLPALTGDVTSAAGSNSVTLNTVSIAKGGTGQTTQTAAFNALSPLTTKGDLIVSDGTNNIRIAVGSDAKALVADSAQAAGVKWADIVATDLLSLATTGIVQRNGAASYSTVTVNSPLTYSAGALGISVGTASGTVAAGDDSRITGALQKSGGTMTGALNMGSQNITAVASISAAAFNYTSDRRLKTDIESLAGLETVLRLRGVKFNWIKDGKPEIGLIAQEVEKVAPQLVVTDPNTGFKAVKYGNMVAPLIESTKELYGLCQANRQETLKISREVASLKDQVDNLKKENEILRREVEEIKNMLLNQRK